LYADCSAAELEELHVVDRSYFASIGAVNPALTAMANALSDGADVLRRMESNQARPECAHAG